MENDEIILTIKAEDESIRLDTFAEAFEMLLATLDVAVPASEIMSAIADKINLYPDLAAILGA